MSVSVATRGAAGRGSTKIRILAWISYGLAVVGGAALPATFVGGWISGLVGFFPSWVAVGGLAVGLVVMGLDLVLDAIPNRLAVWMAILLPSFAAAVHGDLGARVRAVASQVAAASDARMGAWLGESSMMALAAFGVAVSLLVARRVVRKGGS